MTGPCGSSTLQGLRDEEKLAKAWPTSRRARKSSALEIQGWKGFTKREGRPCRCHRGMEPEDDWEHNWHHAGRW